VQGCPVALILPDVSSCRRSIVDAEETSLRHWLVDGEPLVVECDAAERISPLWLSAVKSGSYAGAIRAHAMSLQRSTSQRLTRRPVNRLAPPGYLVGQADADILEEMLTRSPIVTHVGVSNNPH
jgi:hypothetical protein